MKIKIHHARLYLMFHQQNAVGGDTLKNHRAMQMNGKTDDHESVIRFFVRWW
ncbi:hypothetical protein [Lacticaseibacillus sp. N501-2]|uniref:hypothetical protein n=1 Tax=Lacticaseibacillus salsurae TaxID=3367729 RepID=UPI0038B31A5C